MHDPEHHWFCVRSKPRRQNVAAAHLRSLGVEVFNPTIRRQKASANAPIWRTEPLFLNYLFARFSADYSYRMVRYGFGVSDIVSFGDRWVTVPEREIEVLREQWGASEELDLPHQIEPGSTVQLSGRLFYGMEATVICLLPARQRVKVLLEFLGGLTETEVDATMVVPAFPHPLAA
jgi:transcriptional antiterminator RfaH